MYQNGKYFCKACRAFFERADSYSTHSCVEMSKKYSEFSENISDGPLIVGKDQENLKAKNTDDKFHTLTIRNQFNDGQRSLYLAKS